MSKTISKVYYLYCNVWSLKNKRPSYIVWW